ncbi:MAG: mechanosensitive ion channel [Phycisphaerae bacterium]|nr:mechanosensitive ion channel [Phycisphaerae bacterium]
MRCVAAFCALAGLGWLSGMGYVLGQETDQAAGSPPTETTKPQETRLTPETIQTKIAQLEQDKSLDPEVQKKAIELWKEALASANLSAQQDQRIQRSIQQREEAPKLIETIRAQLAEPATEPTLTIAGDAPVSEFDQGLAKAQSQLAEIRKTAEDLERRLKDRADRRAVIDKSAAQASSDLEKLNAQAETEAEVEEHTEIVRARRIAIVARRTLLSKQLQSSQEDLAGFDLMTNLYTVQRDQAVRQLSQAQKLLKLWQEATEKRRRQEAELAEQKAQESIQQAAQLHPAIQRIAEENQKLTKQRTGPNGLMQKTAALSERIQNETTLLDQLKTDFARVRERATTGGEHATTGLLLLNKRSTLPNLRPLKKEMEERKAKIADAHFQWIEYQEQRSKLADPEQAVNGIMSEIGGEIDGEKRDLLEKEVRSLLQKQAGYLDALLREYESLLATLSSLDNLERQLVYITQQFGQFIDERILWIKSTPVLDMTALGRAIEAGQWILNPGNWKTAAKIFWSGVLYRPVQAWLMVVVWALLIWYRKKLRKQIPETVIRTGDGSFLLQTGHSLWQVGLLAISRPYLLWMLHRILADAPGNHPFPDAAAAGLLEAAKAYLILELVRGLLLPGALGTSGLGWSNEVRLFVRRHLRWLTFAILLARFVQTAIEMQSNNLWKESLGRIAFIAGTLSLAVFLVIVLAPNGMLMRPYAGMGSRGLISRFRYLWYPGAILLPGSLAVIAGMGYFYTAEQLYWRVINTILLCVSAAVAWQILSDWLTAARRTMADREYRLQQQEQAQAVINQQVRSKSKLLSVAVPFETIYRVSQQSERIIRAFFVLGIVLSIWGIWRDVLPALGAMDRVVLWETTAKASETVDAAGKTVTQLRTAPVTLSNLVAAMVVTIMTLVTARNLPGLVQIAVLQRVGVDRGIQFAITTLSRYAIVVAGVVIGCGQLGINWSKVQWLVAAMTVGLGFGLQEIFANFVSGLIILFERPMRVGDIVTSGDITGKVWRIQIRSTTIQTWDNKELVVPNKEFVTGRLMNWTLSNPELRISFPIGVAYGSDIAKVEKLLHEVAQKHPDVMKDPAPTVVFMNFGASSLDFDLRLSIPTIDVMLKVRHEINRAIDQAFRNANIEIPFPQQDLHVRTIGAGLPVEIRKTN